MADRTRIAGQLSTALARACDLSINDFEILLRLDHTPPGFRLTEPRADRDAFHGPVECAGPEVVTPSGPARSR